MSKFDFPIRLCDSDEELDISENVLRIVKTIPKDVSGEHDTDIKLWLIAEFPQSVEAEAVSVKHVYVQDPTTQSSYVNYGRPEKNLLWVNVNVQCVSTVLTHDLVRSHWKEPNGKVVEIVMVREFTENSSGMVVARVGDIRTLSIVLQINEDSAPC